MPCSLGMPLRLSSPWIRHGANTRRRSEEGGDAFGQNGEVALSLGLGGKQLLVLRAPVRAQDRVKERSQVGVDEGRRRSPWGSEPARPVPGVHLSALGCQCHGGVWEAG